jgi:two-component system phosphate regulon sensor histidine kinase PhoR
LVEHPDEISGVSLGERRSKKTEGDIAQLVEQRTENPCVAGSIPAITTKSVYGLQVYRLLSKRLSNYFFSMRAIYFFYALVFYVLLQFVWWSVLLVKLNNEVFEHRIENVYLKSGSPEQASVEEQMLVQKMHQRWWMVVGEGAVFLGLLTWGILLTRKSYRKETELARMQKNFLLSVTHEFKSPLASIKLYLQTILKYPLEKEKSISFISKAIADAERLETLMENTMLANRVEGRGYTFAREEVDLSELAIHAVQKFNSLPEQPAQILSNVTSGIMMNGDKLALSLVFNNLLENAIKYSAFGNPVLVELKKEDAKIILRVVDNGTGIPDDEKEKVFRKFYRIGNEETRNTKGTGLGLYLVKYIVMRHNGKIIILNNNPQGCIFEIEFGENLS